jgi:hypothetical protein
MSRKKGGPTPTKPIGADAVGRYRDRVLDAKRHDPYQAPQSGHRVRSAYLCDAW